MVVSDDIASFVNNDSAAHPIEGTFGVCNTAPAFFDFVSLNEDNGLAVSLIGFSRPIFSGFGGESGTNCPETANNNDQ
jgi:hypothetical protein